MVASMSDQARSFLERRRVGHLATADASGIPHVVPICFALLGDNVYVSLDEKPKRGGPMQLRRVRNIEQNPHVAVVADVYDDADWARLGFVLLHGRARVLSSGDEHQQALIALRRKYAQYRAMALEERPIIAITVERVTSWGQIEE
jgi:coenzyme F420-0:L-glutamate ligase/coenzyme F420-1:gamma-L-glutamate ligase